MKTTLPTTTLTLLQKLRHFLHRHIKTVRLTTILTLLQNLRYLLRRRWLIALLSGVGFVLLAQASLIIVNAVRSHSPIIGLNLEHQAISHFRDDALSQQVRTIAAANLDRPVILKAGSYQQHVSPRQLGARLDEKAITKRVLDKGRQGTWLDNILTQDSALFGGADVPLSFSVMDDAVATTYLKQISQTIYRAPLDAHFSFQDNHIAITPESSGAELPIDTSLSLIRKVTVSDTIGQLELPVATKSATITGAQLQPFVKDAERIVAAPLTISANDKQVSLTPQQLTEFLEIKTTSDPAKPSQTKLMLAFSETKINGILDTLGAQVNSSGQPKIMLGRTVLSNGQPTISLNGPEAKVSVITELLKREQASGTAKPSTVIQVPVQRIDPPAVNQYDVTNPLNNYPAKQDSKPVAYLTFDDGPGGWTEQTLDILKARHVHAIFFLVGRNVAAYPATVKRIVAEGHTIGNHSYTHSDLSKKTAAQVTDEINQAQAIIQSVSGITPTLFRPPYGAMNPAVSTAITNAHLSLMMWSVDPRDWSKPGSKAIIDRVVSATKSGSNILLHSTHQQTAEALPAIIDGIRAKGITLN